MEENLDQQSLEIQSKPSPVVSDGDKVTLDASLSDITACAKEKEEQVLNSPCSSPKKEFAIDSEASIKSDAVKSDAGETSCSSTEKSGPERQTGFEQMLLNYVHDLLVKKNFAESAKAFAKEAHVNADQSPILIDMPCGFLLEWWVVFWDIFQARNKVLKNNLSENASEHDATLQRIRAVSKVHQSLVERKAASSTAESPAKWLQGPLSAVPQRISGDPQHNSQSPMNSARSGSPPVPSVQQLTTSDASASAKKSFESSPLDVFEGFSSAVSQSPNLPPNNPIAGTSRPPQLSTSQHLVSAMTPSSIPAVATTLAPGSHGVAASDAPSEFAPLRMYLIRKALVDLKLAGKSSFTPHDKSLVMNRVRQMMLDMRLNPQAHLRAQAVSARSDAGGAPSSAYSKSPGIRVQQSQSQQPPPPPLLASSLQDDGNVNPQQGMHVSMDYEAKPRTNFPTPNSYNMGNSSRPVPFAPSRGIHPANKSSATEGPDKSMLLKFIETVISGPFSLAQKLQRLESIDPKYLDGIPGLKREISMLCNRMALELGNEMRERKAHMKAPQSPAQTLDKGMPRSSSNQRKQPYSGGVGGVNAPELCHNDPNIDFINGNVMGSFRHNMTASNESNAKKWQALQLQQQQQQQQQTEVDQLAHYQNSAQFNFLRANTFESSGNPSSNGGNHPPTGGNNGNGSNKGNNGGSVGQRNVGRYVNNLNNFAMENDSMLRQSASPLAGSWPGGLRPNSDLLGQLCEAYPNLSSADVASLMQLMSNQQAQQRQQANIDMMMQQTQQAQAQAQLMQAQAQQRKRKVANAQMDMGNAQQQMMLPNNGMLMNTLRDCSTSVSGSSAGSSARTVAQGKRTKRGKKAANAPPSMPNMFMVNSGITPQQPAHTNPPLQGLPQFNAFPGLHSGVTAPQLRPQQQNTAYSDPFKGNSVNAAGGLRMGDSGIQLSSTSSSVNSVSAKNSPKVRTSASGPPMEHDAIIKQRSGVVTAEPFGEKKKVELTGMDDTSELLDSFFESLKGPNSFGEPNFDTKSMHKKVSKAAMKQQPGLSYKSGKEMVNGQIPKPAISASPAQQGMYVYNSQPSGNKNFIVGGQTLPTNSSGDVMLPCTSVSGPFMNAASKSPAFGTLNVDSEQNDRLDKDWEKYVNLNL